MRILINLAMVMAAVAISVAAAAEPPAPAVDEAAIKQLVADLGAKESAARDVAQKRLVELGLAPRPYLLVAAKSDDPEVSQRAKAILAATIEVTVKDLGFSPGRDSALHISPDGQHVAYVTGGNDRRILVCDGHEGPVWDQLELATIFPAAVSRFSSDGSLAYWAKKGEKSFIVIAGQEDKAVELPGGQRTLLARSADGKHMAYALAKNGQSIMVIDGKEGPPFPSIFWGVFSANSQTFAYQASLGEKKTVWVVGGQTLGPQTLGPYESTEAWAHSPDGKRFAFAARENGKETFIVDGKEGAAGDPIEHIIFSPDSKALVHVVRKGVGPDRLSSIFLDGKEVGAGKVAQAPVFSPDGRQLAWATSDGEVHVLDIAAGKSARVAAGAGRDLTTPVFSPDGKHVAFAAGQPAQAELKWNVHVDDHTIGDMYDASGVMFWDGPAGGGTILMLDAPGFSADGRHVFVRGFTGSYAAHLPGRKAFMVIDGLARPEHDDLWIPDDFKTGPKTLRYIVRDGDRLRLVEAAWPEDRTWETAAEKPAAADFKIVKPYAEGRLSLRLAGAESGITVSWSLPQKAGDPAGKIEAKIEAGKNDPVVRLFHGTNLVKAFAPSGAPVEAPPYETARAGRLECTLTGPHKATITLRDLEFDTATLRQIGPLEVELDIPPLP
jgi:Tol biopolymer transport system component